MTRAEQEQQASNGAPPSYHDLIMPPRHNFSLKAG